MESNTDWHNLIVKMQSWGIVFLEGLTEAEITNIETINNFLFPPDLRQFLSLGLPISKEGRPAAYFPDWRNEPKKVFEWHQEWVQSGILFDVEHNQFWLDEWGDKPNNLDSALTKAALYVQKAPPLLPIYGHRFLPVQPNKPGNPVLSVMQTDIICYGSNLEAYFYNEFKADEVDSIEDANKGYERRLEIPFWGQIVS